MEVCNKVKQLRLSKQMTQAELCIKAKISRQTLYKIENKKTVNINSATICKLAAALEVDPADIFLG